MFLAIETRICAKSKGNDAGENFIQVFINFRHCVLSLATLDDLNSLSIRNPTMIWIFLSFITTPIFLETLRIFFKTLMQDSLSDLSLSLSRSNFLNLVYISFCRNSFFSTFLIVLLFGSFGLRFFKAYRERSKSKNITMSDSSISYRTFVFTCSRSSLVLRTSTHWISLLSTSIFQ